MEYPEKVYLIHGNEETSFQKLNEVTNRIANAIKEMGVKKGDFVSLLVKNCPSFIFIWFAILKLGGIMVPINPRLTVREISYILNHAQPKVVFVGDQSCRLIPELKSKYKQCTNWVFVGEEKPNGTISFADLYRMPAQLEPVSILPNDVAVCLYTSGTTGPPKGVLLSHKSYLLTANSFVHTVKIESSDRLLTANPLFHVNAQFYSVMGTLVAGATFILIERFSASRMWDLIRHYKANKVVMLLAITNILFNRPARSNDADNPAKVVIAGGAPRGHYRDFEKRFGVKLQTIYSLTESPMGIMSPSNSISIDGGIGVPMLRPQSRVENKIKIVDDHDRDVPRGVEGEIIIQNPAVMKGYFKEPSATAEALRGGWLHTGDQGKQDQNGYFYFLGRMKDIIRKKGENISATEVEAVINSHKDVRESAVIGISTLDGAGEEELKAYVVFSRDIQEYDWNRLIQFCMEHLAEFKIPRYWQAIDELPKNAMNRIMKQRLKKEGEDPQKGTFDRER
ncbi:MAG: AMP-binding protein, partial [Deltaproteobacteria bacterium]|nr:AMP-binding protein [Deltaproteobacteria bacterium]